MKTWPITVLSLFPEIFPGPLKYSLSGKAKDEGIWSLNTIQIRDFSTDAYQSVDDRPYGGGNGMVMLPEVLDKALTKAIEGQTSARKIYFTPRGKAITQPLVDELATSEGLILLCGRFEGIDQRIIDHHGLEEVSLGDFVLSGGEIASIALIDACLRKRFGVITKPQALAQESFGQGEFRFLLEYPHYTRPAVWKGMSVPEVLLSGNHKEIEAWRKKQAEEITKASRPDLWLQYKSLVVDGVKKK